MCFTQPNDICFSIFSPAILMIGEPTKWESCLQLLIDLLLTDGKPTSAPASITTAKQLPIIACNMDLVFMAEACMPRFGHGAFLVCLEALYKVCVLCILPLCCLYIIYITLLLPVNLYFNYLIKPGSLYHFTFVHLERLGFHYCRPFN